MLSCHSEEEANILFEVLTSDIVKDFYSSRIFWDDKRPIKISLLSKLNLFKAASSLGFLQKFKDIHHSSSVHQSKNTAQQLLLI